MWSSDESFQPGARSLWASAGLSLNVLVRGGSVGTSAGGLVAVLPGAPEAVIGFAVADGRFVRETDGRGLPQASRGTRITTVRGERTE